ncbi:unnamed protein product [Lathyrus sativus]|nr:unnamed protein product [Lathyrus sativus]
MYNKKFLCPKLEEQVPVPETGGTVDVFTISTRLDSLQVRSRQGKRWNI